MEDLSTNVSGIPHEFTITHSKVNFLLQLSDLSCTICNIKFKRKSLLDEHMENHLSSRQSRKHLKNYCYVCRRSFEPEKYKVHIQTEHQFDFPKMNNNKADDLFSCENGFVLLSKRKIKKGIDMPKQNISPVEKCKSLVVSVTDIKIEPTDKVNEEFDWAEHQKVGDKSSIQKSPLKVKIPKLKCSICSMRCKGEKGLKIHMSAHKRSRHSSYDGTSSNENENNEDSNLSQSPKGNNANIPLLLSNNGAVNYVQNAQPNYIFNVSQFQNQSNNLANVGNSHVLNVANVGNSHVLNVANVGNSHVLNFGNQVSSQMNSANQVNAQFLQSIPNQDIQPFDTVPEFDCNSEKYMKWLKKFVAKCREHNYPLNPELCRKVSLVTEEVTNALGNPKCSLKQKANHFYFMRMYNILTEIMLNHLQHTLCSVSK